MHDWEGCPQGLTDGVTYNELCDMEIFVWWRIKHDMSRRLNSLVILDVRVNIEPYVGPNHSRLRVNRWVFGGSECHFYFSLIDNIYFERVF